MQNPPYSIDDEKWKKYESYRPILHLTMCQLHVTLQKFQNDVNEVCCVNIDEDICIK
ncbi:unnamed protein product [Brugia pahangi]|uniref:Uncharacterized protein n=1 Tax=Brugia pahangi TaxID=6280 RepID=A0A0N4TZ82_BRUPA|nr:unnamed protein product [Brugia pahangi]